MADQRVNINIGTSFSGEGMQKAMGAVNNMSRVAGKAAGAVGSISGSISGMDGAAGKAIGSISRLMGALAMGGPLGLAIAGVTALIGAFQNWREETKKAKEEQEKLKFDVAKRQIDSYQESVNSLAASLEKVAKFQATFNKTLAAVQTNQATVEATQALIAGEKGGTSVTRAEGQRNATAITQAQNIKNAQTTVGTAKKTLDNANKAADAQRKAIEGLEAYAKSAQESVLKLGTVDLADEEGLKELSRRRAILSKAEANLAAAKEKERELTNAVIQANNEYVNAQEALNATKTKAELENIRAENAVVEAKKKAEEERIAKEEKEYEEEEKAREEAVKAAWEQAAREKERNDRFREEERMEKKLRDEIAKEPKLRQQLDKATEDLKNAEYDLANKLRNAQIASNALDATNNGGVYNPNGAVPGGRDRSSGPASNNEDWGNWGTFGKPKGWDARRWQTHPDEAAAAGVIAPLSDKDLRDKARLMNKMAEGGYENLGDADKKRWDDIKSRDPEAIANAAEKAAEKAAQEKEAKQAAKDAAEQQLQANVQEIVTLMNKLGLQ